MASGGSLVGDRPGGGSRRRVPRAPGCVDPLCGSMAGPANCGKVGAEGPWQSDLTQVACRLDGGLIGPQEPPSLLQLVPVCFKDEDHGPFGRRLVVVVDPDAEVRASHRASTGRRSPAPTNRETPPRMGWPPTSRRQLGDPGVDAFRLASSPLIAHTARRTSRATGAAGSGSPGGGASFRRRGAHPSAFRRATASSGSATMPKT